ncbi:hypothetical protein PT169_08310 [Erysipelothrix rhusiopathiae]|nr:hypothetical protein [Erysipelothrix rhusiopathiae]
MKVDFHCHTKATKSGEAKNRNVSDDLFAHKVVEAEVKILVISNHNHFDLDQFNRLSDLVKEECMLWPGAEIDVIGTSGKEAHLVVVANPKDKVEFSTRLMTLVGEESLDTFKVNVSTIVELFSDMDIIYSPHHLKAKQMTLEDIAVLQSQISNPNRILMEPSTLFGVGVLNAHGYRAILGSDGHSWDKYEQVELGQLKFEISSFERFCDVLDKDFQVMEDLRNISFNKKITVYGDFSKKKFPFEIPIYNDINIIYGDKGSGKSEILESLNEYFRSSESIDPVFYQSGRSDDWFKSMLSIDHESISAGYAETNCVEEFKHISDFLDTTPQSIISYYRYFERTITNKKIQQMGCRNIEKIHKFNDSKLSKLKSEQMSLINFREKIVTFSLFDKEEHKPLLTQLDFLVEKYKTNILSEFLLQKAYYLFDNFIDKIQKLVSDNTGTPSKPTSTGFECFSKNRFKLDAGIRKIEDELSKKESISSEYIGDIGSKGKGVIETKVEYINFNNTKKVFANELCMKKKPLVDIIDILNKINYRLDEVTLSTYIQEFKQILEDYNIKGTSTFVAITKLFKIDGRDGDYNPSKGEKAILNLQHNLISKMDEEVFLIDEPELSLGGKYIEENILPILLQLGKSGKIVVIATHNGNLAVRTRPTNSIYKKVDNNIYTTYTGSMFTDRMTNIDDPNDCVSWIDSSLNHLEGGPLAFDERRSLYEK